MKTRHPKPYLKYKPSGVEWLGDVPSHWDLRRTKSLLKERSQKGFPNEPLLAATQTKGVVRKEHYENRTVLALRDLHLLKLVYPGDFVISLRSFQGGIEYAHDRGIISPAYTILYPENPDIHGYLAWLFKSKPYIENLTLHVTGIRQGQNIDYGRLCVSKIPLPSLPEQTAIVRYLDKADERIRRYISSRERLIELLEEYRQAIIHHAVTRGLDSDMRLKPSGVEWLGDVPAHWEVAAVKRHYSIQLGKMLQNGPNVPTDIAVPYLKAQHVQWFSVRTTDAPTMWASPHEIEQFGIRAGDLLVCEGGEGGRCSLVEEVPPGYIIQNALHRVRSFGTNRNDYLQYVMSSISKTGWFDAINNKATIAHFTAEKFGSLMIPVPPIPEQTAIVAYLDKATADIDAAIDRARREIELLSEYRTRLIADVVTGQVDVRDAATRLPDEAETLIDAEKENRESTRYVID